MSKGSDQQIATETRRWYGAMQLPPSKPQFLRRSIDEPGNVAFELGGVCTTRSVDAVDAAALLFGGSNRQPELLLQGARKDAAHGVALPSGGTGHLIDGCALGSPQHRDDLVPL